MRLFTMAILVTMIVGAFGAARAATPLVFFRDMTGMYFINSDGTGLKLLDGDGRSEALWISRTEVVYSKQLNLWKINIETGMAEQLTTEGRVKNPGERGYENEYGGYISVDCPIFNQKRNELYYRCYDEDTLENSIWKVMDLKTKQAADLPGKWGFITDAMDDKIYGNFPIISSQLTVLDLETGKIKFLTEGISVGGGGDSQATISPDGTKLAFTRDMGIWIYDLAKNTTRFLYKEAQGPIWSPDGRQLFCENQVMTKEWQNQYGQIIVVNLDGTAKILVQGKDYEKGAQSLDPSGWTKDGNIIWLHRYSGLPGPNYWSRSDIKLIDPRTGAKSIIVKNGEWPVVCPY